MAGKRHLTDGGKQAAVAAVVVGQDLATRAQGIDRLHQRHQVSRCIQIRHLVTELPKRLRQHAASHAVLAAPEIDQQQAAVHGRIELWRQRATHIGECGKSGDDQRHRRGHFLGARLVLPLRAHGERILADRNRNAQRRTQLQADRFDGSVESSVFARFTAGRHPVGRQFDARQFNRCRQQIGNGLGHCHATGRRRIERGQRRALAHAHGLAGKALEVGQRNGAIGHRHLPGPDHLVAVRETAHRAVTDRDQKALGRHRWMREHGDAGLLQIDAGQVNRRKNLLDRLDVALHLGRLAQQDVHRHLNRRVCIRRPIADDQIAFLRRHPDHRKRTAFALAQRRKQGQRLRRDGQHVALLTLVAPDLFGRHAGLFERHGAQVKTRATRGVIGEFGKGVGQTAGADVVDRQDRIADLTSAALP